MRRPKERRRQQKRRPHRQQARGPHQSPTKPRPLTNHPRKERSLNEFRPENSGRGNKQRSEAAAAAFNSSKAFEGGDGGDKSYGRYKRNRGAAQRPDGP